MERLLAALGHPERRLAPVVHVAGTNGKGSVIAYLGAVLRAAGYRVQAYTSPHLQRFNERIRLVGGDIDSRPLVAMLEECEAANAGQQITFFEVTTAAALLAFAREPADFLLLEVGLGGRFDATNIVTPRLVAITPVAIDHVQFLGRTLAAIASEKAGILKAGVPAVIGRQPAAAMRAIAARAADLGVALTRRSERRRVRAGVDDWSAWPDGEAMVVRTGRARLRLPRPALPGRHQIDNAGHAIACLAHLEESAVGAWATATGLTDVVWPARMQRLERGALAALLPPGAELWLDGGHNPAAGRAVAAAVRELAAADPMPRPLQLVIGMMATKDARGYLRSLAALADSAVTVAIPDQAASLDATRMAALAVNCGLAARPAGGVGEALAAIAGEAGVVPPRVLVCGSLYLAGAVLTANAAR